ncbi:MAG: glycosyltransferase family 39 protein [Clostridia bacterium]|nr:glycosyltransferase family 39 protein [Clostridia bacterium]
MQKNERCAALVLALVCSALALAIASTSSPLYAANFWTDSNLYFTIGRGMTQGLMPYRDLFDHKGPLIFVIYALGALVSDTSFFGVFLLEVLSLACALYLSYRTVALYGRGRFALLAVPLTAILTATCVAFNQGGSAEEFCLPALALGLYAALARMREDSPRPALLHAAFGAAMGWVFAIKYTDCGLFFGLALFVLLYEWRVRGFGRAFVSGLWMLAGMGAVVLPLAGYLALHGVLDETIQVYFIENIFGYGEAQMSFGAHIYNALAYLRTQSAANPLVAGMAMAGCAFSALYALAKQEKGCLFEAMAAPAGAGLLLLFCYWGEMAHPYYALVFASLVPLGMIPLMLLPEKLAKSRAALVCAAAAVLAIMPLCQTLCQATVLQGIGREDMAQHVFADIMRREENPTLLDLSSLDQGFYLAAGITPNCRYFANNNLNTVEKREALNGYLAEKRTMFVVSRWEDPGENYALIAEHTSPFDLGDVRTYKLYRRVED